VPAVASEEELALQLLDRDDVLVHPGHFFDLAREAYLIYFWSTGTVVEPPRLDATVTLRVPGTGR
jgi:hypothetical protein